MCGIAGYINTNGTSASHSILKRMLKQIAHRGPDGEGIWLTENLALGHRRLAIIDLTDGGSQPMQTLCKRYTITYNGEIYNYLNLRTELHALGHRFQSESDTEVVLASISQWGLDAAIKKFNGMFAFALWDSQEQELHLARDRFGVKPLYWSWSNGVLAFGSEIKALIAHPEIPTRLNPNGVQEYLTFQNFHSSQTLFQGVFLLEHGSILTLKRGQTTHPRSRKFHTLEFNGVSEGVSYETCKEELQYLFKQAVERQLVSDVDVAGYLSGGIDSGAIVSVASAATEQMRTFTCGFDLSSISGIEVFFDERRAAELMSAVFATEQYEVVLKSGDMERVFPDLVHSLEEPRVGQSYPNYIVAGLAARFNKVVLAGTGGDELFGGYPWRYAQSIGDDASQTTEKTFQYWHRMLSPHDINSIMAPIKSSITGPSTRDIFEANFPSFQSANPSIEERLNTVMTYEANTFLQGLLVVEDKVSMAHGLEGRVPFMDNDLADFASTLPAAYKVDLTQLEAFSHDSSNPAPAGKTILRDAVSGFLPNEISKARKQGFSAPDASWFRGSSMNFVTQRLLKDNAKIYQVVSADLVKQRLQEHFSGKHNHRLLIWSLLHLEEAFDTWSLV